MDDDDYHKSLVARASIRTLDDVADDVREHLSGAVESVIKAGQNLQEGRDMHTSDNAFHDWCMAEFPELSRQYNYNLRKVASRFHGVNFSLHQPKLSVLVELAAGSVPEELVEEFMSSEEPVKVKDVKQAKAGYKKVQEDPEYVDILQELKDKRKTPVEAAKEAWDRSEKKRKEIESRPNVFDLNAHIKSTEHCSVDVSATNLVVAMEQLISKFDKPDVMMYLYLAVQEDVLNIKIPALHEMSNILIELCEQLPLKGKINQNAN
jgi:hypothetical protein